MRTNQATARKWLSRSLGGGLGLGLLGLAWAAPAQALELRVAIERQAQQVKVGASTNAVVRNAAGRKLGEIEARQPLQAHPQGNGIVLKGWRASQLQIEPSGDGYVWIGDRWYRGSTQLVAGEQGVTAINRIGLQPYLYSVVGAEMQAEWPLAALKAQAVAARTYALYQRDRARARPYDFGDTTTSQVYRGIASEHPRSQQAVRQTSGQLVTYNGAPILAAFHAASGGYTANVEDVWSQRLPYLRGVRDFDRQSPYYQWQQTLSARTIGQRLAGVDAVQAIEPQQRTPRGRVAALKVVGEGATVRLSGPDFREALDLRSTQFQVTETPQDFRFRGRGFGHGIGLSQWGARELAQRGNNYRQILGHYYSGVKLTALEQLARNRNPAAEDTRS
ncbi:MAG: sporulation protein [Cyanobacteria bacterium QS_8_64_29]|nr:MAG: sporulation protein [Cyanobacteria bacterium QS_8_64_29]